MTRIMAGVLGTLCSLVYLPAIQPLLTPTADEKTSSTRVDTVSVLYIDPFLITCKLLSCLIDQILARYVKDAFCLPVLFYASG